MHKEVKTYLNLKKKLLVLETTKIDSAAGKIGNDGVLMSRRPFRSPHHNISDVVIC